MNYLWTLLNVFITIVHHYFVTIHLIHFAYYLRAQLTIYIYVLHCFGCCCHTEHFDDAVARNIYKHLSESCVMVIFYCCLCPIGNISLCLFTFCPVTLATITEEILLPVYRQQ